MSEVQFKKEDFGDAFAWGVSTAAYQVEGAYNKDGKGPSIWDVFANKKGKTYKNQNANTACDFYNRYMCDVLLMKHMNIPNYRFSLSWSRLMPEGTGKINKAGVEFYHNLIDFCHQNNIEPWVTIYHWDLPHALELKGGWRNREIINWFSDYTTFCIKTFGDKVKHWMVLNEPMVFTGAGYFLGVHAPGRKGLSSFLAAAHHATLCQAQGGKIIRSLRSDVKIGTTFSCSHIEPHSTKFADVAAAKKADALLNKTFIEPLLGRGYPTKQLKVLNRLEPFIKDGDESKLAFDMDFIGVQNYTREIVRHSWFTPLVNLRIIKADERKVPRTVMNWEVHPPSIYHMLKMYAAYPNIKQLIVTENGAAFPDEVHNGQVHDAQRKQYLQQHIAQVLRAKNEGVNVNGYFVWSFTDNFEWAEGYQPRFGLVHVNYQTQQRIVKDSGKWFQCFLQ